jgi:hypothetical protein
MDITLLKTKIIIIVVGSILIATGIAIKIHTAHSKDAEVDFTAEQKAVLKALRSARADLDAARGQLEKTKAEITLYLDQAKATAVAQSLDPNVSVGWVCYGPNGQYATRKDSNPEVPVMFGFRSDHLMMWKYADDKP